MIRVRIAGLSKHDSHQAVVLLDEANRRAFTVWVWWEDYWMINRGLKRFPAPEPMPHELTANLLKATRATLEGVVLYDLQDDKVLTLARLRDGESVREVRARSGDALALAVIADCPIYVAEALLDQFGQPVSGEIHAAAGPGHLLDSDALERLAREAWDLRQRPTMGGVDQVVEGLYIGGGDAIPYAQALREARITRVLKLSPSEQAWPDDFLVFENGLDDNELVPPGCFERSAAFIREQREAGHNVLVACWAGVSRSSTFVLAYLVGELGYDLRDAWALLRARHPRAWPAPEMWTSLIAHFSLPYTLDDVKQWLRI